MASTARVLIGIRIMHLIEQVGLFRDPIDIYLLISAAINAITQGLELPDQLLLVHNVQTIPYTLGALLLVLQDLNVADCQALTLAYVSKASVVKSHKY